MKLGKVTGKLTLASSAGEMAEETVLTVDMEGSTVAALDRAGAVPGDSVLVIMGHAASRYAMASPVDAVVAAVVKPEGSGFGC